VNPALLREPAPKVAQKEVETYSTEQIERIFAATSPWWPTMAVKVLLGTGMRLSELCGLIVEDFEDGGVSAFLKVRHGKGAKVPAGPSQQPTETRGSTLPEPLAQRVPRPAGFLLLGEQRIAGDQPLVSRCDLREIHGDLLVTDANVTCGQTAIVYHTYDGWDDPKMTSPEYRVRRDGMPASAHGRSTGLVTGSVSARGCRGWSPSRLAAPTPPPPGARACGADVVESPRMLARRLERDSLSHQTDLMRHPCDTSRQRK
jgi:hypothetical protein